MKTLGGWLVLVALGAGAGCVSTFPFSGKAEPPPPPVSVPAAAKPSTPAVLVTAEQVNKSNAREMADSLRKELDLEVQ
jgi:hypothetical protein